jgi:hypothetical protein
MHITRAAILTLLVFAITCCSCSRKTGSSITAQDIAKAMPEFTLTPPPGSTNIYFERNSKGQVSSVYYQLTVPRASLSNFLWTGGFSGEFIPLPPGTMPSKTIPLPAGLNAAGAMGWISDVRHAAAWDLGKGNAPLRMTIVKTSASSSPDEQVFLLLYVNDSASSQAPVYFEYHRVPKLR